MALCESQLDTSLPHNSRKEDDGEDICDDDEVKREGSDDDKVNGTDDAESSELPSHSQTNGDYDNDPGPPVNLPLNVDYRSPLSHFVPPAVEMYANASRSDLASTGSGASPTPAKRKRGRPRIDKTSPDYLAKSAARKQAKEIAAANMTNNSNNSSEGSAEKRKRGRPRIDKTSPEYLARKRAKELETLERKARRQNKRRNTADSAASSSTNDTPREKRKYTKRPGIKPGRPRKDGSSGPSVERVKGKRGRPRKSELSAGGVHSPNSGTPRKPAEGKIRVRSNLMPINSEPISLDSDDEPDLGSPSQASDSISFDENLRALRHIHEKYANLERDDAFNAQLLAANCRQGDIVDISGEDHTSVNDRVEKLEDSSNSDSDSSSSGSGSSSSSSSSSGSSSSDSSDSDSEDATKQTNGNGAAVTGKQDDDRSFGAWSNLTGNTNTGTNSDSESSVISRASPTDLGAGLSDASMSNSDNESPDKSFQCHICRRWYSTQVTLKIHRRSHQTRSSAGPRSRHSRSRYSCDECTETFTRREKLWNHRAEVHRGTMTVRCDTCSRCFEDERDLIAHQETHSPNERAGRCGLCGAVFGRVEALRRHRLAAHGPPASTGSPSTPATHACTHCGKTFTHPHSLSRHVQNHARQLYRCVVCKASFARADQLAQHLNSHLANYKRLKP